MITRSKQTKLRIGANGVGCSELAEITHGIIKATVDNKHITLSFNDISYNETVLPQMHYAVSSRDTRSGYLAHKATAFPLLMPEGQEAEQQRGQCLNYATEVTGSHTVMRIVGHVLNMNTQEVLFSFSAHTLLDAKDPCWCVTIDDFVDHGTVAALI